MADISKELEQIKKARYGRDVRDAIHDSIKAINEEVIDYGTTASAAAAASEASAEAAATSATTATQAAGVATTKASEAETSAQNAATSETNAAVSETAAQASAQASATSETNAAASETAAAQSAQAAATSESNAKASENVAIQKAAEAATSESAAAQSKTDAAESETAAAQSAQAAATSESNAKASEDAAKASETASKTSETNASNYADTAKSYAAGGTGTRTGEDTDNAKYYKEQAQQIVGGIQGGFVPMGTIIFEQLASQSAKAGYMYNISDDFTSDATFKDGAGIDYPAGTNVYYTADGMWDCLTGSAVLGVKGNKETVYRKGMVNITPENIGALAEDANAVSATKAEQDGNGNVIADTYATKKELSDGLLAKADNIYYDEDNDKLQLKSGDTVLSEVTITGGGGGGVSLPQPTNVSIVNADEAVTLKWTDPDDVVLDGITLATWAGTLVVRKVGSKPTSKSDGVIVVDSKTHNQYASEGFTDSNLSNGTTYYYGIFPYTDTKLYTYSYTNSITPSEIYPSAATDIAVSGGNSEATVTFTKPSDATGIRIVYGTTTPTSETDGTVIDTTTSPYTISNLTNDTEYFVRVYSYNAKGRFTATDAVSVTPKALTIVTWADGSLEDIAKMLEAHYAGTIDVADYWAVGDTRNISLNGTKYAFAIMGFNHHDLTTSINGKTKAACTIGMVKCFDTDYYMNSSNTNSGGWTSSYMRQTVMNTMKGYLPTDIQNIMKQVNIKTSAGSQSKTINTTSDYCFLPSEIEVFGSTTYSVSGEGTQLDYYKTSANRIKQKGTSNYWWWERSPYSGNSTYFCGVGSNGPADTSGANVIGSGVSFCLCI